MKYKWLKINFDTPFDRGLSMYEILKMILDIDFFGLIPKNTNRSD